jgi:hypothetical protein
MILSVCLAACGGSAPKEPATPAPAEAEEPQGDTSATLDVFCTPSASEVRVDGKPIGESPISKYKVPPGPHDVTCVDPKTGPSTMAVTLEPGEVRSVSLGTPASVKESEPPPEPGKKK